LLYSTSWDGCFTFRLHITIIFIFNSIGPYWLRKPTDVEYVNGLLLEDQRHDVSEWICDLRDKRKSFRRRGGENLRVQAILTSTLRSKISAEIETARAPPTMATSGRGSK
jgi:hypothetical protein